MTLSNFTAMTKPPSSFSTARHEAFDWRGMKLLLVEDTEDHQCLMSAMLCDTGIDMSIVGRGEEAIAAVEDADDVSRAFDVVLMDIRLPTMDGYETTRRLRALGYAGPIVAITARVMREEVSRCLASGCDVCLAKPFDRATLFDSLSGLFVGIESDC